MIYLQTKSVKYFQINQLSNLQINQLSKLTHENPLRPSSIYMEKWGDC
jgi:hypothetical protein